MEEPKFAGEALQALIAASREDDETLEFIAACFRDFEAYHASIIEMETWLKLYSYDTQGKEDYQAKRTQMDKARAAHHNAVLSRLSALNRLAKQAGVSPVYGGTVSEERPYRRQAANAVLGYLEELIAQRL